MFYFYTKTSTCNIYILTVITFTTTSTYLQHMCLYMSMLFVGPRAASVELYRIKKKNPKAAEIVCPTENTGSGWREHKTYCRYFELVSYMFM